MTSSHPGKLVARTKGSSTAGLLIATGSFRSAQNMAQTTFSLLGLSLGFSGAAIGAVAAGSNLIAVLTMLLVTAHLATSSAQRAIFVGLLFMTASLASFLEPSPIMLLVGSLLLGIAGGLVLPSAATAIGDLASSAGDRSRAARGRALAMLALVLSISLALGPLYESLVLSATHERLQAAYLAFLPVPLIGAVVARGRRMAAAVPAASGTFWESMASLGSLFRNREWSLAVCGQAIYMVPFALVIVFAGLLGSSLYHASASTTEIGIALFFIVSFLCRAALTRRPAVRYRVKLFALCVVATLCGIALLAIGHGTGLFMVALAVLGAPHGLTYPLALGLVSDAVPIEELARANAGFQAVSNLISVVVPFVFGLVIDQFGDRAALLCAAIPVLPLAGLLWLLRDAG
ncbi:MAG: MFS transporter [Steroidobacteraceae bacterium]